MLVIKLEELTVVAERGVDSVGVTEAVDVGVSSAGGFLDLSVSADEKSAGVSNEGRVSIVAAVCISETGHIGLDIDNYRRVDSVLDDGRWIIKLD